MHNPASQPNTDAPVGITSRTIALEILNAVLSKKQQLDIAIDQNEGFRNLSSRDRAFIRMLVSTTVRRLGQIDHVIAMAAERDEPPHPPLLHHVLRLGATQILFMNTPDHAVVDTMVSLAGTTNLSKQKGFVNAVLRRLTQDGQTWVQKQDAGRLNTPEWLMKVWIEDYGLRTAAEIAQANLSEASLNISVKDPSQLENWAGSLNATILETGSLRCLEQGLVQELPGFKDGMWWVQDAAAAIPAMLFGDIRGETVIDLCAAPGGKTAQLASMGANVIALDRSVQRMKRLNENIERLRLTDKVKTDISDAAVWLPRTPPEYILLDAPCTATGTARRNPDVLHLKTENDLERITTVQKQILDNAIKILAPGGILIYCTCSLQKAEGEHQIERLLSENSAIRRLPVSAAEVGDVEGIITENGDIRTLPFHMATHGGMDGFYIARLQKC